MYKELREIPYKEYEERFKNRLLYFNSPMSILKLSKKYYYEEVSPEKAAYIESIPYLYDVVRKESKSDRFFFRGTKDNCKKYIKSDSKFEFIEVVLKKASMDRESYLIN